MSEEPTPGQSLQNLLVSGIRLYTGLALYSIEQLQNVTRAVEKGGGLPAAAGQVGSTLESVTGFLASDLDGNKQAALRSVSRVAAKAVAKSAEVLSQAAASAAETFSRPADSDAASPADLPPAAVSAAPPQLAVDVLTGTPLE